MAYDTITIHTCVCVFVRVVFVSSTCSVSIVMVVVLNNRSYGRMVNISYIRLSVSCDF